MSVKSESIHAPKSPPSAPPNRKRKDSALTSVLAAGIMLVLFAAFGFICYKVIFPGPKNIETITIIKSGK
ncbi:MAG: hypothetical protein AAFO94_03860 [Bacteroidota bacterium]